VNNRLALVDYRHRVAAIYAEARRDDVPAEVPRQRFVAARDVLFAHHPSSPLEPGAHAAFRGLHPVGCDPAIRVTAGVDTDLEPDRIEVRLRDDGHLLMTRLARLRFRLPAGEQPLSLYWIEGYGGGPFPPLLDATAGDTTYGGGRYLLDTIKHADLGSEDEHLPLDVDFAYHPSCRYSSRWDCPLAPAGDRLGAAIPAGERLSG
jgi:uncharacterized protein (DUF1684 family)